MILLAANLAVDMINNRTCDFPDFLSNTKLKLQIYPNFLLPTVSQKKLIVNHLKLIIIM